MTRLRRLLLPALLLGLVPAVPASAAPPADHFGDPVVLALGDSVAAGFGALPDAPGYPELVRGLLSNGYHPKANKATPGRTRAFDLESFAVRGATTTTLLRDQLPAALAFIEERQSDRDPKNDVEVITLTIGGNDVFRPVIAACVLDSTPTDCQRVTDLQLAQVRAGVTPALQLLTAAAGKHVEVIVTTYYNPIGSCFVAKLNPAAPAIADVVLEGASLGPLSLQAGLNDVIRAAAAATGAQVADLDGELGPEQYVGGGDCLHPNAAGHAAIAEVVTDALAR